MKVSKKILAISSLLLTIPLSQAVFAANDDELGWNLGVSVGYEREKSLFKFDDEDGGLTGLPTIEYVTRNFIFSPFGLEVDAYSYESGDWGLDISSSVDFGLFNESRDASDSRIFAGMDERKESTDLSLEVEWTTPVGIVGLEITQDIGGAYKSNIASIQYGLPLYFSEKTFFAVGAGVDFFSAKYVDYYYGVRAHEVTGERSAYKGKSASSAFVGYQFAHQLSEHWSIINELKYSDVPDEIRLSSLTEDEDKLLSTSLLLNYSY
ncbi:MAG: MipA/OmpV family protein [Arenicella sp.]